MCTRQTALLVGRWDKGRSTEWGRFFVMGMVLVCVDGIVDGMINSMIDDVMNGMINSMIDGMY